MGNGSGVIVIDDLCYCGLIRNFEFRLGVWLCDADYDYWKILWGRVYLTELGINIQN